MQISQFIFLSKVYFFIAFFFYLYLYLLVIIIVGTQ